MALVAEGVCKMIRSTRNPERERGGERTEVEVTFTHPENSKSEKTKISNRRGGKDYLPVLYKVKK